MKTYAMLNELGLVQFVAHTQPSVPEVAGLIAVEVEPGFDGTHKRWNGSHFIEVEGAADNDAAMAARSRRNRLLAASDWTQGKDAPLTKAKQAEWAACRQALRDVTDQPGFPTSISWPAPPTK